MEHLAQRNQTSPPSRIGFIGLGLMGKPMAKNLVSSGFEVMVASRSAAPVEELRQFGAIGAASLAELAHWSDAVITMLPTPVVTDQVVLKTGGVLESMRGGTILVDMGTETPDLARQIHRRGKERGVMVLDAPVSGGDTGAIAGTLSVMCGGEPEAFALAEPIFNSLASSVRLVGGPGSGQAVKAVNQIMVAGILATIAEGLALLERSDVDMDQALAALGGGRAASTLLEIKAKAMLNRSYTPGFKVELHLKDLDIVAEIARSSGVALPVTALVRQLLIAVEASGGSQLDHSAVIEAIRGLSLLELSSDSLP